MEPLGPRLSKPSLSLDKPIAFPHESASNGRSTGERVLQLAYIAWIIAAESIKILYVSTCACSSTGFTTWIFPAYHHAPYTFWDTYHGTTFLAGPYSLIWWLLNLPAYYGYASLFAYFLTCDIAAFLLLQRKSRPYALYFLTLTLWFVTLDPVDFFPVVFAVAGRYRAVFLVLAPLTKLPIGAPAGVWTWVFTSSNSFSGPENYGRYLIMGAVWLFSLVLYVHGRRSRQCKSAVDADPPVSGPSSTLATKQYQDSLRH